MKLSVILHLSRVYFNLEYKGDYIKVEKIWRVCNLPKRNSKYLKTKSFEIMCSKTPLFEVF